MKTRTRKVIKIIPERRGDNIRDELVRLGSFSSATDEGMAKVYKMKKRRLNIVARRKLLPLMEGSWTRGHQSEYFCTQCVFNIWRDCLLMR